MIKRWSRSRGPSWLVALPKQENSDDARAAAAVEKKQSEERKVPGAQLARAERLAATRCAPTSYPNISRLPRALLPGPHRRGGADPQTSSTRVQDLSRNWRAPLAAAWACVVITGAASRRLQDKPPLLGPCHSPNSLSNQTRLNSGKYGRDTRIVSGSMALYV